MLSSWTALLRLAPSSYLEGGIDTRTPLLSPITPTLTKSLDTLRDAMMLSVKFNTYKRLIALSGASANTSRTRMISTNPEQLYGFSPFSANFLVVMADPDVGPAVTGTVWTTALEGDNVDSRPVTCEVITGVTSGVKGGVTVGVMGEVTDGVTSEVTDGVTSEVTSGVTDAVTDGVTEEVSDRVTDKVTNGGTGEVGWSYRCSHRWSYG
jgi:hypothetical protein